MTPSKREILSSEPSCVIPSGAYDNQTSMGSEDRPFRCTTCDKSFKRKDHFKSHQVVHSREKPFQCKSCLKSFARKDYLKRHVLQHAVKGKPHKCNICQVRYAHKSKLACHLKHIHDPKYAERYNCIFCATKFITKTDYMRHLLTHTQERPVFCKLCSHESQTERNLKVHNTATHEPNRERNFQCELCSKSFFSTVGLRHHISTHTGEKAYKCDVCNKSFIHSSHLTTHLKTHTREKPYQCQTCWKKFSHGSHLKRHIRIHTGDRPYKCRHCNKLFGDSSNFKRHERTHEKQTALKTSQKK